MMTARCSHPLPPMVDGLEEEEEEEVPADVEEEAPMDDEPPVGAVPPGVDATEEAVVWPEA